MNISLDLENNYWLLLKQWDIAKLIGRNYEILAFVTNCPPIRVPTDW